MRRASEANMADTTPFLLEQAHDMVSTDNVNPKGTKALSRKKRCRNKRQKCMAAVTEKCRAIKAEAMDNDDGHIMKTMVAEFCVIQAQTLSVLHTAWSIGKKNPMYS